MTDASKGLRTALARSAAGAVLAIGEMPTDELLASMNDEQKADLAVKLGASAPAPAAAAMPGKDDEDGKCSECGKAEKDGKPDCTCKAKADETTDTATASADRIKIVAAAVASDETCKGKAELALSMLADDDFATLSASGIIKIVGASASASTSDPDDAARAEMQRAISANANSQIDANGKPGTSAEQSAAGVWDQAHSLNNFGPAQAG